MIIVMQPHASEAAVQTVVQFIRAQGLTEHLSRGTEHTIIGAVGDERVFDPAQIEALPEVERAIRIMQDWRIISREAWADDSQIIIRGIPFGGTNAPQTIAYISSLKTADLNEVKTGKASSCAAETEGGNETETSKPQSHAAEISEVHAPAVLLDPFYLPANPYAPDNNAGEADIARLLEPFTDSGSACRWQTEKDHVALYGGDGGIEGRIRNEYLTLSGKTFLLNDLTGLI